MIWLSKYVSNCRRSEIVVVGAYGDGVWVYREMVVAGSMDFRSSGISVPLVYTTNLLSR